MRRVNLFFGTILLLLWVQFRETGLPGLSAELDLSTGVPARVYLFKDDRPFRLSPVDALLPLHVDLFYRERLWRRVSSPATVEVTANEQSHFFLLRGRARFVLPPGKYRVEAYRGFLHEPAFQEFTLAPRGERRVELRLQPMPETGWLSGDDHIHLTRAPEDDDVFLGLLEAEDLSVGNFLQLQRQMDAAVQTSDSTWIAARASSPKIEDEPDIRAHTNPVYVLRGGRRVRVDAARRSVLARWEREAVYYRTGGLSFADESQRRQLLEKVNAALDALRK